MKRLNIFALMLALLVSATCLWSCSTEDDGADADTSLNDSDSDSDNDDDDGDNDNDSSVTIVGEWVYTYPDGYETDTIIFKSDGSFEVTYDYGEESTVCNGKYAITGEILTLTYTGAVWYKNDQETDRADIEEGDMVEYYC